MTRDRNRAPTLFKVGIRGVRFGRRPFAQTNNDGTDIGAAGQAKGSPTNKTIHACGRMF